MQVGQLAYTATIDCGKGFDLLTNDEEDCGDAKSQALVRAVVAGLIIAGLWQWGEKVKQAAAPPG